MRFICFLFPSFFFSVILHAQDNSFMQIKQKFEDHNKLYAQEKLFVHTDKEFYLAGEIIYFKIYNVDGSHHRPANLSKVAYVEISDAQHKSVLQAKISLSEDGGSGSFYLPLSLNSGNYVFRAYTNWMKNFGKHSFFEKRLSIINTIKHHSPELPANTFKGEATFFPEGGHLVADLSMRLGFKVVDSLGKGVLARVILISDTNDTILESNSNQFGIGSFVFTPVTGRSYNAVVLMRNGQFLFQKLPAAENSGYVMNVTETTDGKFKIHVQHRQKPNESINGSIFLLAHTRRVVKSAQQGYMGGNREFVWFINKKELGEGISHLTLFNEHRQAVCERLVFVRPGNGPEVKIDANKTNYNSRDEVNLGFNADGISAGESINCSVSIFQVDSLFNQNEINLVNYLWLKSELQGEIESAGYYFSGEKDSDLALDNLLLTQGWRKLNWDNLLTQSRPAINFIPEIDGHIVTGTVIQLANGRPAANVDCYLSVPSYPFGFYVSQSDSLGRVTFNVRNYYGPGEVIAQVSSPDRQLYRVDLVSPYTNQPAYTQVEMSLPDLNEDWLLDRSIGMQAQNIYLADSIRKYSLPVIADTLPFYGRPEFTYNLDDYKRFTTMEEVFREYVMQINVGLKNSKMEIRIFDETIRQFYDDNILLLLDGIPIYEYNKIFTYDPLKIRKLEIVPRRYLYGSRVFSGIASFESTNEKFDGYSLDPSLVAVDYEGLQLQREFYSPSHANPRGQSGRIPDLRTTLFWEPFLKVGPNRNKSLKFFTSDMKGRFVVVLNGISKTGHPVFAAREFKVN